MKNDHKSEGVAQAAIGFALDKISRGDEREVFLAAFRSGDRDALAGWSNWPSYAAANTSAPPSEGARK